MSAPSGPHAWLSLVLYYTRFAQREDCGAQFEIAELWNTHGKSPSLARHWYERAARNGHPGAAAKLARCFLGDSPPNFELAFRWGLIAVERGNKAGYELAKIAERYLPASHQLEIVREICAHRGLEMSSLTDSSRPDIKEP